MNLFAVYHIYPHLYWKKHVENKLNRIKKYNLFLNNLKLYCVIIQPKKEDLEWLNETCKKYNEDIKILQVNENYVEHESIKLVKKIGDENDGFTLYFHTKGCANNASLKKSVLSWDELMSYITIDRWNDCIKKLENYNCIGANFIMGAMPKHFSGNFWWARNDYIKKLQRVDHPNTWRFHYEFWIGYVNSLEDMNPFCPYRSPFSFDNYANEVQEHWYKDINFEKNYLHEFTPNVKN